jgi:alkanesulfonate monooxygenase SsuD/methylene tetrahydromethanopterin reductase-like flavin-dependent oxidoreductase (luciferase family)
MVIAMELWGVIGSQTARMPELEGQVRRWEEVGVAGVFATDHLFFDMQGSRRTARREPDPYILLAAAGAVTKRAKLGTIVANAGLQHPALLLRHFSQLARLFGGERVYAGLGAGWNREEFEALGLGWQAHSQRMQRLEETMMLGRQLFDEGYGHLHGAQIVADDLPLSPEPGVPPRLMLGGGSARALQMGGRYADHVDLNSPTKAGKVSATIGGAVTVVEDNRKRLLATVAGLEESVGMLAAAASEVGRPAPTISVMLTHVVGCPAGEVEENERRMCEKYGLEPVPLGQCPFALVGPPERMVDLLEERAERLGLASVILPGGNDVEAFATSVFSGVKS